MKGSQSMKSSSSVIRNDGYASHHEAEDFWQTCSAERIPAFQRQCDIVNAQMKRPQLIHGDAAQREAGDFWQTRSTERIPVYQN